MNQKQSKIDYLYKTVVHPHSPGASRENGSKGFSTGKAAPGAAHTTARLSHSCMGNATDCVGTTRRSHCHRLPVRNSPADQPFCIRSKSPLDSAWAKRPFRETHPARGLASSAPEPDRTAASDEFRPHACLLPQRYRRAPCRRRPDAIVRGLWSGADPLRGQGRGRGERVRVATVAKPCGHERGLSRVCTHVGCGYIAPYRAPAKPAVERATND